MDANTVIAICATAIALASFVVSIGEARATRRHNRHAVTPVLEIWTHNRPGGLSGMSLANRGLGPAFVTQSNVWLDGVHLGGWDKEPVRTIRDAVRERPRAWTMIGRPWTIPAGTSRPLLYVENFDARKHGDLRDLIRYRLKVEITYESVYRGEKYFASYRPDDDPAPGP